MNSLSLTKNLLKIESTSDKPQNLLKAIDLVESYLRDPSIFIQRFLINDKPSLVATMKKIKTPKIILNGHLDVILAPPKQFTPIIKGDRLFGRGAQDMKAACVVMMKVFKDLAIEKSFPRNKLGLMFVTDEEIGGFNGSRALLNKGYKGQFFMTGESTDFDIEIAAKGVLWLKLTSKGKTAHGAYLWDGKNAIISISEAIQKINHLFPTPKNEVWKSTCNISAISGGNAYNRVPESCELKLDIRYIPNVKPDDIIKKIKDLVPKDIKLEIIEKESHLQTDKNHPYLKLLKKIVKKETKRPVKYLKQHGASDARFFSEKGIPTTSFGPIGGGLHSYNEWVSLKSLIQYENILKKFLLKVV